MKSFKLFLKHILLCAFCLFSAIFTLILGRDARIARLKFG